MKTILLTGDSRGVGLSIKTILTNAGYNVIGVSRSSEDIKYDLSDVDGIQKLYKDEIKSRGPIHGYVNNAAIAYDDIITNLKFAELEKMYRVNVFSPMMLTRCVIRDMLLNKTQGNIIHISSISAHTGYKGLSMYASSKGSLEAFSKNTAREWGALGIRSNVVCPGFMDTDMSSTLSDKQKQRIFNRNSRKKPVLVEDIAHTVKFLLSDESNGITGQVLNVDNGTI
tara:strand:+ start:2079 stop:2756 length:678 start_codon:yes stop_codon:yes gene_type:complete